MRVAQLGRARVVPVAQMGGHQAGLAFLDVTHRRAQRCRHRVRLRRGGQVNRGVGQRELRLGHADQLDRLRGGDGGLQRRRIRHPDVLAGQDHQPASDEPRVLPRHQHPRQVVQGGVDVGAADRLDERADRRRSADRRRGHSARRPCPATARWSSTVTCSPASAATSSAVSARRASPADSCTSRSTASSVTSTCRRGRAGRRWRGRTTLADGVGVERLQLQDQRPRQQRRDDGERRVLGGGRDQQHDPVLDGGQQRVLLGLGEPVHLVDEQHGLLTVRGGAGAPRR